jgi:3-deoxy-D-manno-octulosonic-acid transferase
MRWFTALAIYRLFLPLLFLAAFPGWWLKMLRRGGLGTRLGERAALYGSTPEFEPCGAVHVHAVSVGESALAIKLIRRWMKTSPETRFVLAVGTATGHHVGTSARVPGLRVVYAPLDLPSMIRRYLRRFEPARLVLIEGELWPNLLLACRRQGIPVALVNARMSPRSERRFRRFAPWLRPLYAMLDLVAIQEKQDAGIWQTLGVMPRRIHHTGSLKFDPSGGNLPVRRPEFQRMLDGFGSSRPIVLAASTHDGEEAWIASAIRAADRHALPVIVPRHAERRAEVKSALEAAGFAVTLRSTMGGATSNGGDVLVVDSTGELGDWTAHADVVVIGKSFLATGGQNPCEAVLARKPVVFGPHMENFEPLATCLVAANASLRVAGADDLAAAIRRCLDPGVAGMMATAALEVLSAHDGATERILELFAAVKKP